MPETMMALRAHARGGAEQLVYESAPVPVPGPGEALIAVHAAAITFAELTWDLSWTTRDGTDRTPVIPSIWSAKIPAAAMSSADVPEPGRSRTARCLTRTGWPASLNAARTALPRPPAG